ncbi:SacI-like domain protein [Toxoplasma gondii VAND]|uniref:SacI-like domain protein n=1 Tax=Toxoplasma gondii VAND TaxID=933077 RepID=A0A086QDX1_TOXGO|nr:SacI-like domain protein [Toxoplasma gondii VAND]
MSPTMQPWEKIESYTVYNFPQFVLFLGAFACPFPEGRSWRRSALSCARGNNELFGRLDGASPVRDCPCVGRIALIRKQMISADDVVRLGNRRRRQRGAEASARNNAAGAVCAGEIPHATGETTEKKEDAPLLADAAHTCGANACDPSVSAPVLGGSRETGISFFASLGANIRAGNTASSLPSAATAASPGSAGAPPAVWPLSPPRIHQRCVGSWACLLELREELHRLAEHAQRRRAQWRRAHNHIYRPLLLPEFAPPRVWAVLHALAATVVSTRDRGSERRPNVLASQEPRRHTGPRSQGSMRRCGEVPATGLQLQDSLVGSQGTCRFPGAAGVTNGSAEEASSTKGGSTTQWGGTFEQDTDDKREGDGSLLVCGLLGAIRFLFGFYLVLATESEETAALGAVDSIVPRAVGFGKTSEREKAEAADRGTRRRGFRDRVDTQSSACLFLESENRMQTADGPRRGVHSVFTLRHVDLLPLFFFESSQEGSFSAFCDLIEEREPPSSLGSLDFSSPGSSTNEETATVFRWLADLSQKKAPLAPSSQRSFSFSFPLGRNSFDSEGRGPASRASSGEFDPSDAACALSLFRLAVMPPSACLWPFSGLADHASSAELLTAERRYQELFLQVFLQPPLSFFFAHTLDLTQSLQAQGLGHASRDSRLPGEFEEATERSRSVPKEDLENLSFRDTRGRRGQPRRAGTHLELLNGKKLDAVFNLFLLEPFAVPAAPLAADAPPLSRQASRAAEAPEEPRNISVDETVLEKTTSEPRIFKGICPGGSPRVIADETNTKKQVDENAVDSLGVLENRGNPNACETPQTPRVGPSPRRGPSGGEDERQAVCQVSPDMSPWLLLLQQGCVVQKFFSATRRRLRRRTRPRHRRDQQMASSETLASRPSPQPPSPLSPPAPVASAPSPAVSAAVPALETRAVSLLADERSDSLSCEPRAETTDTGAQEQDDGYENREKHETATLFSVVIIARRSRLAAGARWYRRGLAVPKQAGLPRKEGPSEATETNTEVPSSGVCVEDTLCTLRLLDTVRDSAVAANQVECEQILWRVSRARERKKEGRDGCANLESEQRICAFPGRGGDIQSQRKQVSTSPPSSVPALVSLVQGASEASCSPSSSSSSPPFSSSFSHLRFSGDVASIVQLRGSVPVFWGHLPSQASLLPTFLQNISPPLRLSSPALDPLYVHSKDHFDALHRAYGCPILCLDLVRQQPLGHMEMKLASDYRAALEAVNRMQREEAHAVLLRLQRVLPIPERNKIWEEVCQPSQIENILIAAPCYGEETQRGEQTRFEVKVAETNTEEASEQRDKTRNLEALPGWTRRWVSWKSQSEGEKHCEKTYAYTEPRGPRCYTRDGVCFRCMYSRMGNRCTEAFFGVPSSGLDAHPFASMNDGSSFPSVSASPELPAFQALVSSPSNASADAASASRISGFLFCSSKRERWPSTRDGDKCQRGESGQEGGGPRGAALMQRTTCVEALHQVFQSLSLHQRETCFCEVAYEAFDWQDADKRLGFDQALHRLFALVATSLEFTGSFVCVAYKKRKPELACMHPGGARGVTGQLRKAESSAGGCEEEERPETSTEDKERRGAEERRHWQRQREHAEASQAEAEPSGFVTQFQHGVIRINCVDCLDRTNLAMLGLGVAALYRHLTTLLRSSRLHDGAWDFCEREICLKAAGNPIRAPTVWWLDELHKKRGNHAEWNEESDRQKGDNVPIVSRPTLPSSSSSPSTSSSSFSSSSSVCSSSTSSSSASSAVAISRDKTREGFGTLEGSPRCQRVLSSSSSLFSHSSSAFSRSASSSSDEAAEPSVVEKNDVATRQREFASDHATPDPSTLDSGRLASSRPRLSPSLSSSSLHWTTSACCWTPYHTKQSKQEDSSTFSSSSSCAASSSSVFSTRIPPRSSPYSPVSASSPRASYPSSSASSSSSSSSSLPLSSRASCAACESVAFPPLLRKTFRGNSAPFASPPPFLHLLPTRLLQLLGEAWREVGDALALQYAGSPAMHAAEFSAAELVQAVEKLKEAEVGGEAERRAWRAVKRSNVLIAVQSSVNAGNGSFPLPQILQQLRVRRRQAAGPGPLCRRLSSWGDLDRHLGSGLSRSFLFVLFSKFSALDGVECGEPIYLA